jgi:hypothetical protein
MIAIFYTGADKFSSVTFSNHVNVIDKIKEKYSVTVYDHKLPDFDRTECTFTLSGGCQVFDFMKSSEMLSENIIIKFRTDIWFTDSSIEMLLEAIDDVVNNTLDIVYLGYDFRNHYSEKGFKIDVNDVKKITDFVVVSNKKGLTTRDIALQIIANTPVTAQTGTEIVQVINTFFQYGGDYMPQEAVRRGFNTITDIFIDSLD